MKKMFAILVAIVGFAGTAFAGTPYPWSDGNVGPYVSLLGGGSLRDGSSVQLGTTPRSTVNVSFVGYAMVNVNRGDCLTYCTFTANGVWKHAVTETTTAGDPNFAGIALFTTAYGTTVTVATKGDAYANIGYKGAVYPSQQLITSGSAGLLTPVAAVTSTLFTSLSTTAFGCMGMDGGTGTGLFDVQLNK